MALSAHGNTELLLRQAQSVRPRRIVVTDPVAAARQDWSALPGDTELLTGPDAITTLVTDGEVEIVVSAIVGSAGLQGTWAALEAGKTVALANKESLVVGGPAGHPTGPPTACHDLAGRQRTQCRVSGVAGRSAGGGPPGGADRQRGAISHLYEGAIGPVTVAEALAHPTWAMGPKVTVDSATLMNKALEIIEARWLFDLRADQIGVVIHPQSIVHSMVEYRDGSVIAQLSPPDMRLPIQYALTWPRAARRRGGQVRLEPGDGFAVRATRPGTL